MFDNSVFTSTFYIHWGDTDILIFRNQHKKNENIMNNLDYYFPGLDHAKYTANYLSLLMNISDMELCMLANSKIYNNTYYTRLL